MVNLYVWRPIGIRRALGNNMLPDFGHASLEVVNDYGQSLVYVSFWPEIDSAIGELLLPFKPRTERHPHSYEQESDPNEGYMQRPADNIEHALGLKEEAIIVEWPQIRDANYHLGQWNCSNVVRLLLLRSMQADLTCTIAEAASTTEEEREQIHGDREFMEVLLYLTSQRFVECRPEDLLRLLRAYKEITEEPAAEEPDTELDLLPDVSEAPTRKETYVLEPATEAA